MKVSVYACLPEAGEVHYKKGRDVVGLAPEVLLPKALLPEPEALHVLVVVTKGSEPKRCTLKEKKLQKKRTTR